MTIRQKTLLLIGITLISLIGVLYATLSTLLMSHVQEVEKQKTQQEVERALNNFSEELAQLSVLAHQWGAWDDTYTFMANTSDKQYVKSNLSRSFFIDFRLNIIILINNSGQKVFSQGFDLHRQKMIPVPLELTKQLTINSPLLQHQDSTISPRGILLLPEGKLLIAAQPIITTSGQGPVRGTLIMGRYLNAKEIERIEILDQLLLDIQRIKAAQLSPDFQIVADQFKNYEQQQPNQELNKLLSTEEIIVRPLSEENIAGYALLQDIYQQPALILRVQLHRDIYNQGKASLNYLILSLVGVGLVFCIGTLFLLEKLVLAKLARLSADVKNIGMSGDLSLRVFHNGNDELSSLAKTINWMLEALEDSAKQLKTEQEKAENLLLNILPQPIAERLKQQESTIADSFAEATVLFADIVGFTKLAANTSPVQLVKWLNQIFSTFDLLAERHGLEKIKTIGDAYMIVGGLPTTREDHAEAVAKFALDMQQEIARFSQENNLDFSMRIGIHTGPVVAGVIGLRKFIYDLWGDTVNTASRMESHGIPGFIQVSNVTYEYLKDKFDLEERGIIEVKGKGKMTTYLLLGKKSSLLG